MTNTLLPDKEALSRMLNVDLLQRQPFSRFLLQRDRWPHYVHYAHGKVRHTPPDWFYFGKLTGPSDCEWIVPRTWER